MKALLSVASIFLASLFLLMLFVPSEAQPAVTVAQAAEPPTGGVTHTATAADDQPIELLGRLGGYSYAVHVQDGYAYMGIGAGLAVLDVADPAHPARVGYVALPRTVDGVQVVGDYAYVAADDAGLRVVDVSSPTAPVEVSSISGLGSTQGVTVVGGYAYVVSGDCDYPPPCDGDLYVVDVSDPAAPVQVGAYDMELPAQGVAVAGGYAYVAESGAGGGLRVVDISNPAALVEVGFCDVPEVTDVAADESYAYVTSEQGLHVVDISLSTAPHQVGFYATLGDARSVTVDGDHAYVTYLDVITPTSGLHIVDISSPTTPTETGVSELPGRPSHVAVVGDHAYVATVYKGLRVVDVSDPTTPVQVGFYHPLGGGLDVTAVGDYVYVADTDLVVVDSSDPTALADVGHYDPPGDAEGVALAGDYAYVAAGEGGLRVVDVLAPTTPTEVGFCDLSGQVTGVAVAGNHAYVAGEEGLWVVDVSTPAAPIEVGFVSERAQDVVVEGHYAYAWHSGRGVLRVVDISDPAAPIQRGLYPLPSLGVTEDVTVADGHVYVAARSCWGPAICTGYLDIVDVSDPDAPVRVGFYRHSYGYNYPLAVAVAHGYAYVVFDDAVCIADVLDPTAPVEIGCHDVWAWFSGRIAVTDDYAYAAGPGGLFSLRANFSLTGQVADAVGAPFSGVTVHASSGAEAITDASGVYTFTHLSYKTLSLTPTLTGYAFWPVTRTVRPGLGIGSQDFTILPGPVSITLTTGTAMPPGTASLPARLTYTDTQGLPTHLDFPGGAVSQTTTLVLTPTLAGAAPSGWVFAGHAFDLAAFREGAALPDLTFGAPVTVTMAYSDLDVRAVKDESELFLGWWTGEGWVDAFSACAPPGSATLEMYARDLAHNVLGVPVCRLGRFALFGPTFQVYLPLISYDTP